ncbi:MAG: hypothetical protein QW353_02275 [Candidatus Korarchaeum sp.]
MRGSYSEKGLQRKIYKYFPNINNMRLYVLIPLLLLQIVTVEGGGLLNISIISIQPTVVSEGDYITITGKITSASPFEEKGEIEVYVETDCPYLSIVKNPEKLNRVLPTGASVNAILLANGPGICKVRMRLIAHLRSNSLKIESVTEWVSIKIYARERYADPAIVKVTSELTHESMVCVAELINRGNTPAKNVNISSFLDKDLIFSEKVDLYPGVSTNVSFSFKLPEEGTHELKVFLFYDNDKIMENNEWKTSFSVNKSISLNISFSIEPNIVRIGESGVALIHVIVKGTDGIYWLSMSYGGKEWNGFIPVSNGTSETLLKYDYRNVSDDIEIPIIAKVYYRKNLILNESRKLTIKVSKITPPIVKVPEWVFEGGDLVVNVTSRMGLHGVILNVSLDGRSKVLEKAVWKPNSTEIINVSTKGLTEGVRNLNVSMSFEGGSFNFIYNVTVVKEPFINISRSSIEKSGDEWVTKLYLFTDWAIKGLKVDSPNCEVTYVGQKGNTTLVRLKGENKCNLTLLIDLKHPKYEITQQKVAVKSIPLREESPLPLILSLIVIAVVGVLIFKYDLLGRVSGRTREEESWF